MFKQPVSDAAFGKQIGNAMSVNVVERLFQSLLLAAGFVKGKLTDRLEKQRNEAFPLSDRPSSSCSLTYLE